MPRKSESKTKRFGSLFAVRMGGFEWPILIILLIAVFIIVVIGLLVCLCMMDKQKKEDKIYSKERKENEKKMKE